MAVSITCDEVNRYIFAIAPDPKPQHDTENVYAWGNPQAVCTGVAVAWWPGPDILRQAASERLNFIVSHEDPVMEIPRLPILPHRSPLPETFTVPANRERIRLAAEHNLVIHRQNKAAQRACAGCGQKIPPQSNYCPNCGGKVV